MKNILITGGAGFIGINASKYYLKKGHKVTILDNLSRKSSLHNLNWIRNNFPQVKFTRTDIRNYSNMKKHVKQQDLILHLAAQVAVTTSVKNPREDFEINALGTLNVLEAIRNYNPNAILLYSSTNKVYGGMENEKVVKTKNGYTYKYLKHGVSENYPLDFHSPYGCSKGSADQYVRDYARIYNLKTIVFRQSCIYGPHQFGVEDQGWIAWFLIAATLGKKITIYGDGLQVRDVLYVDDLLDAYDKAIKNVKSTRGQVYNIGGGTKYKLSIWNDFRPLLERVLKRKISTNHSDWRPGDQKIFVSDIRKAKNDFNWQPATPPEIGVEQLYNWIVKNKKTIQKYFQ